MRLKKQVFVFWSSTQTHLGDPAADREGGGEGEIEQKEEKNKSIRCMCKCRGSVVSNPLGQRSAGEEQEM